MRQNNHSILGETGRGQSLVELALVMPVVLLLVIGMLEVVFTYNDYLQMLDGGRNGARSTADTNPIPQNSALYDDGLGCSSTSYFFRNAACNTAKYLLPLDISRDGYGTLYNNADYDEASEPTPPGCINKDTESDLFTNDIVLSIFTTTIISGPTLEVKKFDDNEWPGGGDPTLVRDTDLSGWSYMRDQSQLPVGATQTARGMCSTISEIQFKSWLLGATNTADAAPNNAYYVVEVFYNHYQLFDAPVFNELIPNPVHLYSYTIFSISAAEATATDEP